MMNMVKNEIVLLPPYSEALCTVHWMEDNFVHIFLGLIQLFLNHYQRLDTYIWYFVRYVSLALIYSPKTMNFCKQGAKNLKKIVFW